MTGAPIVVPQAAEVAALLARYRRVRRRRGLARYAYAVYFAILLAAIYGAKPLAAAARAVSTQRPPPADLSQILAVLPAATVAVVALGLLAALRGSTWHGPVAMSAADAEWLLPLPIEYGPLLRRQARLTLGLAAVAGLIVGLVAGVAVKAVTGAGTAVLLLTGAGLGLCLGILAVAGGVFVQRWPRLGKSVLAVSPVLVLLAVALAVSSFWSALPGIAVGWSGPWGWAALPLEHAAGGRAYGWPAAFALLGGAAALAAVMADRSAASIPAHRLRAAATTAASIGAALSLGESRDALLRVRAARGTRLRPWRLPAPTSPRLVIVWRDATALMRSPSRVGSALLLGALAVVVLVLARHLPQTQHIVSVVAAACCGYIAASRLVEPARLDADDPARSAVLPYPFDGLALRHAVLPTGVLVVTGVLPVLALTPVLGPAGLGPALVGTCAGACVLVAAALAAAYRGRVPLYLLYSGADIGGFGPPGVPILVLWYVAPLLIGTGLVSYGVLAQTALSDIVLLAAIATVMLLAWVARRARAMPRGST